MDDKGILVSLGEKLKVDYSRNIKILINIENKEIEKKIRIELIKNGWLYNSCDTFLEHSALEWQDKVTKNCWYYLRLIDEKECIIGLTNPIFIICH